MKNLKSPTSILIIIVVIFITGFLTGRKNTPSKIVEKIKIKTVIEFKEKIIKVEVLKKNRSEKISEVIIISKDGTKTIKRETIKINKDEISKQLSKISNRKEKTETKKTRKITFDKLSIAVFRTSKIKTAFTKSEYGLLLQKKVVLDFTMGIGFTTDKNFIVSIGYNF